MEPYGACKPIQEDEAISDAQGLATDLEKTRLQYV